MNKVSIIISLLVSTFFLASCSTTSSVNNFTPLIATDNQAIIYIYRPSAISNAAYSPDLYVSSLFKTSIKNGEKTHFILPHGHYTFELDPDKNSADLTTHFINLKAGNTYFFRIDTRLKIKKSVSYKPYQRSFSLTRIEKSLATKQISECCSNRTVVTTKEKTHEGQTDGGFTVDKTQNPFSH